MVPKMITEEEKIPLLSYIQWLRMQNKLTERYIRTREKKLLTRISCIHMGEVNDESFQEVVRS